MVSRLFWLNIGSINQWNKSVLAEHCGTKNHQARFDSVKLLAQVYNYQEILLTQENIEFFGITRLSVGTLG